MKTLDDWKNGEVRILENAVEIDTYKYPQMGGYCAKSTIIFSRLTSDEEPGCFDADIWHDGQWPFDGEKVGRQGPSHLHHCSAEQFIEFGMLVLEQQVLHQKDLDNNGGVKVSKSWRDTMLARLQGLPVKDDGVL